jgi:thiol-disulfide isomerase/thioredoxin
VRSGPDLASAAGRSRRVRRRAPAALALAWIVGACLLGAADPSAEESRFVPWKGGPTPGLELRDLAGRPHALTDYRGQVVLLNFWATWCEFCKEEVASMRKLQRELAGRPLAILSINFGESPAKVRAYAPHLSASVGVLLDGDQDAARAWRVRVIPSSFLVDAEGRLRYSVIGNLDWASEESVRTVRALLP